MPIDNALGFRCKKSDDSSGSQALVGLFCLGDQQPRLSGPESTHGYLSDSQGAKQEIVPKRRLQALVVVVLSANRA
jgi:hypothetical protein